ncbi:MAG: hypothetical protein EOS07_21830 [Mesorhizobium sp.]|uniref:hypothetical protein n=1 Tax=Mesorhizobium sp. TaxID=1871066 RepID=UPI000FE6D925|nr:hypothetical protein [Mesorhizobium sp.]RWO06283.1 MAG: hypothetical protein EOS07_21830 [Mesorhizobium sp.]RWP29857.1 MAG: hypothetical protein EOR03_25705 [Mesorhizobium sp.]RWP69575.1 MAG: hypothetical protein EOR07_03355 [Mesorhizobium sp.]
MADPFRLRVMKAISAHLKSIVPANGYVADLSDYTDSAGRPAERVFRGRTSYGDNDPIPMLSVLEDLRPADTLNGTANSVAAVNQFRILIQGFVKDDKTHPLDPAYHLSAEVIKALVAGKKERFNLLGLGGTGPCVMGLSIGQPVHRPPDDDVSAVAYFLVPVTLTLAENLETPFA